MRSISSAVEGIINQSPFLKELMTMNIVNYSGLARQLKDSIEEETQKEVTEGSVIVALKRLSKKLDPDEKIDSRIFEINPDLTVRSNLFEITVKNSPTLIEKQKKLLAYANRQQSLFATFTYGVFETTMVASNQIYDMAMSLYKGEQVVSEIKNVATITVNFPIDIIDLPFIYYSILRVLAWSGISIVEMISSYSELVIVLDQEDIEKAFSLIKKLFSNPAK